MIQTHLPGSFRYSHPLRTCDKCNVNKPPEGGVELGPGRWHCMRCWLKRMNSGRKQ